MRIAVAAVSVGSIFYIIYKANTGDVPPVMHLIQTTEHADKVAHFVLFGALSFVLNIAFLMKQMVWRGYGVYIGSLLVGLFVVVEEYSQRYLPTRNFDLYDLIADFIGLIVFAYLTRYVARRYSWQFVS